jgi:4-hydroxy-tetrahydrodipicolinate synthase
MFKGSGVALVTPFDNNQTINFKVFDKLLEFHLKNKTDALIISGTTGESSTLSDEEKLALFDFAVKKVKNRIPVIAGTGSNNTMHTYELSKKAKRIGVDGIILVTPYYNKTTQLGLIKHYKSISKINIPMIIYNVPSRTGLNILPETYKELINIKNVVGIKEASGNISQIADIATIKYKNNKFALYSGNDDQIIPTLSLGGDGVISVLANIFPTEVHNMCFEYFNANLEKSLSAQLKFLDLIRQLFCEVNPIPIKTAMNILGYNVGPCRLPLVEMSNHKKILLKKSLQHIQNKL